MSLRTKLFLLFGATFTLLACAQWVLLRSLAQDLHLEADRAAFEVGASVISAIGEETTVLGARPAAKPSSGKKGFLETSSS